MTAASLATFSEGVELTLSSDATATASPSARTIEGIVVPFGPAGRTSGGLLTFGPGSLSWSDPKRVKLLVEHDQGQAVGYATALEERPEGLWASFHLPEGDPAGDRVLAQAANGIRDAFSVGVMLDASVEHNLRRANGGQPVKGTGQLRETSMVSVPAFDDARVGSVAASSHRLVVSAWADETERNPAMPCNLCGNAHAPGVTECQVVTASTEETTTASSSSSSSAPDSSAGSTTSGSAEETTTASTGPARIAAAAGAAVTVASEPSTYAFDGSGPSLVRDAFNARMSGDSDAAERIRKFNAELAGSNPTSVRALTTAAVETDGAEFVPTLHRPDLMRAMIDARRPLVSQVSTVTLTNANPFAIPSAGDFTGVADHTPGTAHAPEGDLLLAGDVVQPGAVSGAYRIGRELIDSSNPILDRIALRKMVKDYRRFTEAKAFAAWTAGLTATQSIATVQQLDEQLDLFINDDEETADFVAMSPTFLTTLKGDVDGNGRPHLARYAPVNATAELTGSRTGLVAVFGDTKAIRASSVTATKAAVVRAEGVLWAESRVQQFSFSEVEGPGIVKLALWAYCGAARLEDSDVLVVDADATV